MNVEIRTEAALVPEKEYIKGTFVAVHYPKSASISKQNSLFLLHEVFFSLVKNRGCSQLSASIRKEEYTANNFGLMYSRKRISQNCQELSHPKRNYENQI
jgi:hypothetical protein